MSHLINNQQKLNDIIFADRNKQYGAYVIRSDYGNTVFKSLSFMMIGIGSLMSVAFYFSNRNNSGPDQSGNVIVHDSIYVIPVNLKKEDPKPRETIREVPPPAGGAEQAASASTVIADSTFQATETTTTAVSGPTSTAVVPNETGGGIGSVGTKTTTGGGPNGTDTAKKVVENFEVDSQPEFEGGLNALYSFVSKHLKYPNWASSEGKEGTVFVKFVVDETGKVGTLSLLNSAGYGMDDEALRVVSLIPKFKSPAKVKGQPVKVYYQMPIRFRFKY